MKNLVKEVIFLTAGDWQIEAFAWSKELSRSLKTSFHVLCSEKEISHHYKISRQILEGDGYYINHYQQTPVKTQITYLKEGFTPDINNYLQNCSGLVVVVLNQNSGESSAPDFFHFSQHIVISIPQPLKKFVGAREFTGILRQISIINLPFNFEQPVSNSFFSRLKHNLESIL